MDGVPGAPGETTNAVTRMISLVGFVSFKKKFFFSSFKKVAGVRWPLLSPLTQPSDWAFVDTLPPLAHLLDSVWSYCLENPYAVSYVESNGPTFSVQTEN